MAYTSTLWSTSESDQSIISLFYSDYTCCIQNSSLSFAVNSGLRQGSVMYAFLFILAIDWLKQSKSKPVSDGLSA